MELCVCVVPSWVGRFDLKSANKPPNQTTTINLADPPGLYHQNKPPKPPKKTNKTNTKTSHPNKHQKQSG